MTRQSRVLALRLALGVLALAITWPLARPLAVGWRCYWLYDQSDRQTAEVVHKLDHAHLVLMIVAGPDAGEACTADTSQALFEATQRGDRLEVVRVESKPGECELESTIEASAGLLWTLSSGIVLLWLGVAWLGIVLLRIAALGTGASGSASTQTISIEP